MVGILVLVLVIVTSVWVGVDANTHRVPQHGHKQFRSQDPWVWGTCCFLLWIVIFPLYLIARAGPVAIAERTEAEPIKTPGINADELLKFKQLLDAGAITQEEFDVAKSRILGASSQEAVRPPLVQMK